MKSYDLKKSPEADYTPNDVGEPERSNHIETWDSFEDEEMERLQEMGDDAIL